MLGKSHIARDISYAHSAQSKSGRALIKVMENMTGRIGLLRRAEGYQSDITGDKSFWDVIVERYGLELDIVSGSLSDIPTTGPLIIVSNHPYGILDGLMMGYILDHVRTDFRILAHQIFKKSEDLKRVILPISFDETKEAVQLNLETRKTALDYLSQGGAIGIFPGGTVSTSAKMFSKPYDPAWRSFTARMISKSNATVVPIYFGGHTSRLFQIASHLNYTLRMGLLIKEFKSRIDRPVSVAIGKPLCSSEIGARSKDARALMEYLRHQTYALSNQPQATPEYGFEFEAKHIRDQSLR